MPTVKADVKYPVSPDLLTWLQGLITEQQGQREALERCATALERIAEVAEGDSKTEKPEKP
jgi:hypothetical protein